MFPKIFDMVLVFCQASANVNEHFICFTCVDGKCILSASNVNEHALHFLCPYKSKRMRNM